jgi:hypothetical protein
MGTALGVRSSARLLLFTPCAARPESWTHHLIDSTLHNVQVYETWY